jgi:glycosyltransferase involved in cell wall biosynthesis
VSADFRVLVDARWVALAPDTSHARYLRALAAEWADLAGAPLLTLVGPGPRPPGLATSRRVRWQTAPNLPARWRRRPGSRLWSNTIFTAISAAKRPDVLFFPWFALPRVLVAPAVVTVHDVCFRTHPDRFADGGRSGDSVLADAVRSATEILTPSAESKRGVVGAYSVEERRVTVVRHGIAPTFNPASSAGDSTTLRKLGIWPPYFLCVSTHEPRKNLEVLVRAFACYLERGPRDRQPLLVLVGRRSADTPRLVELLSASALATEHTRFVDGLSDTDLAALYRHALAVTLPSVCEGFGFPLLESIACGTPALASDLAVFRELVDEAAVYVPALDASAWIGALHGASTDTHLKQRAMEAAARVRCQFAWRTSAETTLGVLARAAGARRKLHWSQPA